MMGLLKVQLEHEILINSPGYCDFLWAPPSGSSLKHFSNPLVDSRSSQGRLHHLGRQEGGRPSGQSQGAASVQQQQLLQQWISHLQRESVSHSLPAGAAHAVMEPQASADGSSVVPQRFLRPANQCSSYITVLTVPYLAVPYVSDASAS